MSPLRRRLSTLEQAAWDRRTRQLIRVELAEVARDPKWTADQFERRVQTALAGCKRMEPALTAMHQQRRTVGEVAGWIAADMGIDVDELLAEMERRDPISTGDRR